MWMSFIKAVFKREYTLSSITVIGIVAAIVYTIWPADVIPDVPVVGWIDDLGFWGIVTGILNWERGRYEKHLAETSINKASPDSE